MIERVIDVFFYTMGGALVMNYYRERKYLSSIETVKYLGITVRTLHHLVKESQIKSVLSTSGQKRFQLVDLKRYEGTCQKIKPKSKPQAKTKTLLKLNNSSHAIYMFLPLKKTMEKAANLAKDYSSTESNYGKGQQLC